MMARSQRTALAPPVRALLVFVCALVLVDTIFFSALAPLLPTTRAWPDYRRGGRASGRCFPAGTLLGALPAGCSPPAWVTGSWPGLAWR